MTSPNKPEPDPKANDSRPVWELVVEDMNERHQEGIRKYGVPLQAFNGRKPLIDAYQEALDLAVYLRQAIEEEKGNTLAPVPELEETVRDLLTVLADYKSKRPRHMLLSDSRFVAALHTLHAMVGMSDA